jgi:hypothetical protein
MEVNPGWRLVATNLQPLPALAATSNVGNAVVALHAGVMGARQAPDGNALSTAMLTSTRSGDFTSNTGRNLRHRTSSRGGRGGGGYGGGGRGAYGRGRGGYHGGGGYGGYSSGGRGDRH